MHEAPYRGLRVLDFGQGIASPYCAMLLGVEGADVIKVEPPEGDWSRFLGTTYGSHTTLSAVYNRGKRSVCLDLKHKDGIAVARRLAKECGVLIEGFRPGVAARLGIGYKELSRDNPGLVYLSVSAFGQAGPYSKRPVWDWVAQAFSGFLSINVGNDGTPHRAGTTISDVVTGVYAFQAIATTLFARATVGTGRWIDVNLCQSTSASARYKVAEHILEGGAPRALNVPAGSYQTTDGWMMVTLVNEPQYKRLCAAIGREDFADDPRFADRYAHACHALHRQTMPLLWPLRTAGRTLRVGLLVTDQALEDATRIVAAIDRRLAARAQCTVFVASSRGDALQQRTPGSSTSAQRCRFGRTRHGGSRPRRARRSRRRRRRIRPAARPASGTRSLGAAARRRAAIATARRARVRRTVGQPPGGAGRCPGRVARDSRSAPCGCDERSRAGVALG